MAENMRADEEKARAAAQAQRTSKKHAIVFGKHHLPYNPGDQVGFHDRDTAKRFVDQGFARWDERFHLEDGTLKVEGVPETSKTVRK